MKILIWLLGGIVLGSIYTGFARKQGKYQFRIFEYGLIIATLIYVGFALFHGSGFWTAIEISGVLLYSLLVILSRKKSYLWIGAGWLTHIFWDLGIHLFGPAQNLAPNWYA